MDVFVSHANGDRAAADELRRLLVADTAATWHFLDAIELRDDWKEEAERVIANAGAFLFVTTELSVRSEACLHELRVARGAVLSVRQWMPRELPTTDLPEDLQAVPIVGIGVAVNPGGWDFAR